MYKARHANCKKPPATTMAANPRPDGHGDGNRFAQVFLLRNDRNGDGKISRDEFRGSASGFDRLDKNKNGFIEADELDELHQQRLSDPKSMRERLESGDAPLPPQGKRWKGLGEASAGCGDDSATRKQAPSYLSLSGRAVRQNPLSGCRS